MVLTTFFQSSAHPMWRLSHREFIIYFRESMTVTQVQGLGNGDCTHILDSRVKSAPDLWYVLEGMQ